MPQKQYILCTLLCLLGSLALAFCWWLILVYAPLEVVMGPVQKIFYLHLPMAWWGLISFCVVFVASIGSLVKRSVNCDLWARAAAEIGVVCATLCLVTGMYWGKQAWGVWWTWDPRLTTALILWFMYTAYLTLEGLDILPSRKQRIRAILGIVAFVDVPLVFLSARMWRSIHPAVFAHEEGGLEPEMKLVAFATVLAMGLLWLGLLLLRKAQLHFNRTLDELLLQEQQKLGENA